MPIEGDFLLRDFEQGGLDGCQSEETPKEIDEEASKG